MQCRAQWEQEQMDGAGSSFRGSEASQSRLDPGSRLDLQDLTWEQRETVLRMLFTKMNAREGRGAPEGPGLAGFSGSVRSSATNGS